MAIGEVDYGAHLGGALGGTLVMLFLLKTWPSADRLPHFRGLAAGIAATGIILMGASLAEVGSHFPDTQSSVVLIPTNQVPKTQAEWQSRASDLVELYPQDPRAHTYRGVNYAQAKDYVGAERELRLALTEAENLHAFFPPKFENGIRAALALVLSEENRWSEGKELVQPACQAQPADRPPEEFQKLLFTQHLCNG
jgi:rhomboid protease GluP